jgi:hypothetical protein
MSPKRNSVSMEKYKNAAAARGLLRRFVCRLARTKA